MMRAPEERRCDGGGSVEVPLSGRATDSDMLDEL